MTKQDWRNRTYFPPFLGLFHLSPFERVFNSILIFLLGAFMASYKYAYIYTEIINNRKPEPMSAWYSVPFVLTSFWLISRMLRIKRLESIKEKEMAEGKFPIKWFLLDSVWDIVIILIMNLIYTIIMTTFIINIWN